MLLITDRKREKMIIPYSYHTCDLTPFWKQMSMFTPSSGYKGIIHKKYFQLLICFFFFLVSFIICITLEGEYFVSAPTKRYTWLPSLQITSTQTVSFTNSKAYIFQIVNNTIVSKKIFAILNTKKTRDILFYRYKDLHGISPTYSVKVA